MDLLLGIYFFMGALFTAYTIGYVRDDKEVYVILSPILAAIWPLVIAYHLGVEHRKGRI